MKLSTGTTLAFLLNTYSVQATSPWRSPPFPSFRPQTATTTKSLSHHAWSSLLPRGGADAIPSKTAVDLVLKHTLHSNLKGDVARGGSTATKSKSSQRPDDELVISSATTAATDTNVGATNVTGGASTPAIKPIPVLHDGPVSVSSSASASSTTTTAVSKKVLKQEKKQEKKLAKLEKKHKNIAKKLKVR
jgi:hypothetical protein